MAPTGHISVRQGWSLLAAAAIVAASAALVAGTTQRPAAALGTGSPGVPASPAARATAELAASPSTTSTPRPTPTAPAVLIDAPGGYWLSDAGAFRQVGNVFGLSCSYDFCAEGVTLSIGPAGSSMTLAIGGGEIVVSGASLRDLRSSWRREVPDATDADATVDGQPAFIASAPTGQRVVFAIHNGRQYAFTGYSIGGSPAKILAWFLHGFHFLAPACWMTPCPRGTTGVPGGALLAFDAGRAQGTWRERPVSIRAPIAGDDSMREFAWRCDGCDGWLRVSIGTTATGPLVAPNGRDAIRLPGADLDSLRASWLAVNPDASFLSSKVGAAPAVRATSPSFGQTLLLVHRGYVIAISAAGTLRWDPAAPFMLDAFVGSLTLLP